jgi:phosphatidate cytidylyltransferase
VIKIKIQIETSLKRSAFRVQPIALQKYILHFFYTLYLMARRKAKATTAEHPKHNRSETNKLEEEVVTLLASEVPNKKWRNWWIRTITTLIMISMFFIVLASGYIWSIIMVMIITVLVYREVIQIASTKGNLRWYKTLSWYAYHQ